MKREFLVKFGSTTLIFKRNNRFGQVYDPNVIPLGSMNYTAYRVDDYENLSHFVHSKCSKYVEVSKAQYGNFDFESTNSVVEPRAPHNSSTVEINWKTIDELIMSSENGLELIQNYF